MGKVILLKDLSNISMAAKNITRNSLDTSVKLLTDKYGVCIIQIIHALVHYMNFCRCQCRNLFTG